MILRLRNFIAARPAFRHAIRNALSRVPVLDNWLRRAIGRSEYRPAPLQVDAAHIPEQADEIYRRLQDAVARRASR